ncbi:ALDH-like protein [Fistulina hepatica ATCC 64428]|uniref:ALDH-like protein n=1 Tax=Fistulina hepatica ATCC 64428 TaxID=1128425 RepID=A0A0D7AA12_9AGAR|nr:ALDH-like protein [Fistulina hepatica ATCC 64428]
MSGIQTTITPWDGSVVCTRPYPTVAAVEASIEKCAASSWSTVPLRTRIDIARKFIECFKALDWDTLASELTLQMGRPVSQCKGEFNGMVGRAEYMISIAEEALKDVEFDSVPPFKKRIKRVPHGVVMLIVPWNYPYLTTINTLLPALVAGNTVILKPSERTPLTGERLVEAWCKAGLPQDCLQLLHLTPELTQHAIRHPKVSLTQFTGSVRVGRLVEAGAATAPLEGLFKTVGLELGGKDPAYVRADANLEYTVAELMDGSFFNSGQSCCAIERIYVHESIYPAFVSQFRAATERTYRLGDPRNKETNLGPVISVEAAASIRAQVKSALEAGAQLVIPAARHTELYPLDKPGSPFVGPQALVGTNHTMDIVMEETFGPVVPIMRVRDDAEAVRLMNDSKYGLTASIWTSEEEAFTRLADQLKTGTVFMNRCDFLDPALAWTGVKDSGRGVSLSKFGYDQLTRAKSIHVKIVDSGKVKALL